jgi:hypothetical protein
MTKVLLAIDEERSMLDGFACVAIIDVATAKADAQKMVEALIKEEQKDFEDKLENTRIIYEDRIEKAIKETEQRVAKDIIEYCEKHKTVRKVNGVRHINIEQLRLKYKGVE